MTRIQKLIGERMLESKLSKPCFYIESRADITELMSLRPKLRKAFGVKITTNAFYIHVLALAVREYPLMVGTLDGDEVRIADEINVGFAVNTPQGLLVPVIKNADRKMLAEIAGLEKLLTEKARDNKLTLEEMEGATIVLSNLGAYGIDSFFGIVPPSATAILAVGNAVRTALPIDGEPVTRRVVSLALAVDHKVVDGAYAARFLGFIRDRLQDPKDW